MAKRLYKGMRRLARLSLLPLLACSFALPSADALAQGSEQDIRLVVETPEYVLDEQGLRVPGYELSQEPGAPRLPVWTTLVEAPAGANWSIIEVGSEERLLRAVVPLPPAPVTELHLEGPAETYSANTPADALSVETRRDPAIYGANALYPAEVAEAGPVGIARGKRLLPLRVYPFQYNPITGSIRYRPRIEVTVHFTQADTPGTTEGLETALAPAGNTSEPGVRVFTVERGIYGLTYEALVSAGFPASRLDPAQVTMWHLDEQIDIEVTGQDDGRFDPGDAVLFYAEPYVGRYMTQNVYRLTWSGPAVRMRTRSGAPALHQNPVTTILRRTRVEYDRLYLSTFGDLARDADHFFDDPLYPLGSRPTQAVTYTLTLDGPVAEGEAELQVSVHGGRELADRSPDQSLALRLNGQALGPYTWDGSVTHIISQAVPAAGLVSGANMLVLEAALSQLPGVDLYYLYPNWAEVAYPSRAGAKDNRLYIEAGIGLGPAVADPRLYLPLMFGGSVDGPGRGVSQESGRTASPALAVGEFTSGGIQVYDVSDARHPVRLTDVNETNEAGSYRVTFAAAPDTAYYLTTPQGFLSPAHLEYDEPSFLRAAGNNADYIVIVHRSLWDAVQPLLDHRSGQGLHAAKVDVQDVYDEFSGGRVDPEALRSFLSYAYHNWNAAGPPPQYVLLVGDGHYDFTGALRPDLPNLIPPYMLNVDPFIGETAADNRYACADGDDDFLPDMAIGRIPATSPEEVAAVVDKILAYENGAPPARLQQRVVFVGDDKNDVTYDFHGLSEETRTTLPAGYETETLYYHSSPALDTAAEMKTAIRSAFDGGPLYLQWFGHASRYQWGKDRIWELDDPITLAENTLWPLTAHYSCWAGYFINLQSSGRHGGSERVLAEALLLAPKRGSLADFAPSGLHLGDALVSLDKALTRALFSERIDRVGLAVDAAKIEYYGRAGGAYDVIDTQLLLGDPATRLKLP